MTLRIYDTMNIEIYKSYQQLIINISRILLYYLLWNRNWNYTQIIPITEINVHESEPSPKRIITRQKSKYAYKFLLLLM